MFRPTTGTWYIRYTATPTSDALAWGGEGDIPVPGDYDGDGKADIAVFRLSDGSPNSVGTWYIRYTATATRAALAWGGGNDSPILRRPAVPSLLNLNGTWSGTFTSTYLGGPPNAMGPLSIPFAQVGNQLTTAAYFVSFKVGTTIYLLSFQQCTPGCGALTLGGQTGTTVTYVGGLLLASFWPYYGCGMPPPAGTQLSGGIVADTAANMMTGTFWGPGPYSNCSQEIFSFTLQKQ